MVSKSVIWPVDLGLFGVINPMVKLDQADSITSKNASPNIGIAEFPIDD